MREALQVIHPGEVHEDGSIHDLLSFVSEGSYKLRAKRALVRWVCSLTKYLLPQAVLHLDFLYRNSCC